ncbi:Uu.00g082500.m01.CDS01 [Anthostomella pinea]|uniref:Uu.00g082500.m01.CDS01 n=1 Tax=Anthostomella pinea TaxID=933095 RepID=A0AAI8YH43_9PEZI|nr:Uu.00g082500.m01.CDS01 [Anthostomella pinea]
MARTNPASPAPRSRRSWVRHMVAWTLAALAVLFFCTHLDKLHRPSSKQLNSRSVGRFAPRDVSLGTPDIAVKVENIPVTLGKRDVERLLIIGDVHGMGKELNTLLEKVIYDKKHDHVILVGDVVTLGLENKDVVDLARKDKWSAVTGNHEWQLLAAFDNYNSYDLEKLTSALKDPQSPELGKLTSAYNDAHLFPQPDKVKLAKKIKLDVQLANDLGDANLKWIRGLPHVLRVGDIQSLGHVVVVHAGFIPNVEFKDQSLLTILNLMNMQAEDGTYKPVEKGGEWWADAWNSLQKQTEDEQKRTTVVYGHDQGRGLKLESNTLGLDSGCKKGGTLTALILKPGKDYETESVKCRTMKKKYE